MVWDNGDGRFDNCCMFSGIVLCREEMGLLWGEEKRWLLLLLWYGDGDGDGDVQIGKTPSWLVFLFFCFLSRGCKVFIRLFCAGYIYIVSAAGKMWALCCLFG